MISLAAIGCGPRVAAATPTNSPAATQERPGVRFPRAELVDIAAYVSDKTGKGFILGTPELRTIPITLYQPGDVAPERLEQMFLLAIEAGGLVAEPHEGFWLIRRGQRSGDADHGGAHKDASGMIQMDFRGAPVEVVTGFISSALGKQVVVTAGAGYAHLTIQAHDALSAADAYALILVALRAEGLTVVEDGEVLLITKQGGATVASEEKPHAW